MTRILAIHPGSDVSTVDVWNGIIPALYRQGATIHKYNLSARIGESAHFFQFRFKRLQRMAKKKAVETGTTVELPTYGQADILYHAAQDALAKALRMEADWVLVLSGMYLHPDWLILMKRAGLKVAVMLTESPYDDEAQVRILPHVECAWTNERTSVEYLRQFNPNVDYLPHAFDPLKHTPQSTGLDVRQHDVVFVGTGFQERIDLLSQVDWSGIDLGLYGTWELLGSRNRLRQYIAGGYTTNEETNELYRQAKIGLNLYRTSKGFGRHAAHVEVAESLNPRALELAASGAFQISSFRAEVNEVFEGSVPTFETSVGLEQAIRDYLADEEGRRNCAEYSRARIADWTFDARAAQMMERLRIR